jgi:hypothetical protein
VKDEWVDQPIRSKMHWVFGWTHLNHACPRLANLLGDLRLAVEWVGSAESAHWLSSNLVINIWLNSS